MISYVIMLFPLSIIIEQIFEFEQDFVRAHSRVPKVRVNFFDHIFVKVNSGFVYREPIEGTCKIRTVDIVI